MFCDNPICDIPKGVTDKKTAIIGHEVFGGNVNVRRVSASGGPPFICAPGSTFSGRARMKYRPIERFFRMKLIHYLIYIFVNCV